MRDLKILGLIPGVDQLRKVFICRLFSYYYGWVSFYCVLLGGTTLHNRTCVYTYFVILDDNDSCMPQ